MIKIGGLVIIAIAIGFFVGKQYSNTSPTTVELTYAKQQILKQVLQYTNKEITKNHCEFDNHAPVVSDFFTSLIKFSLNQKESHFLEIACDRRKKQMCEISFGQQHMPQAWSRSLFFSYAHNSDQIDSNSFECIDVP